MRFQYTYTEYEGFPKATEISRSRNCLAHYWSGLDGLLFLASVICLIVDFVACWPMIFTLAISIAWFVYLVRYYDKVTEKKVRRAINRQIEEDRKKAEAKLRGPDYNCKSIKIVSSRPTGKCLACGDDNVALSLCDIQYRKECTVIPICNKCIARFQTNAK